ncbi:putative Ubiquitin domain-containing protein [Arabidopsis thaliana]
MCSSRLRMATINSIQIKPPNRVEGFSGKCQYTAVSSNAAKKQMKMGFAVHKPKTQIWRQRSLSFKCSRVWKLPNYKFEIELGYWDTVLEIKQKIEKYQRILVYRQTLFFQGNVLQDHLDIEQCVILNHSLLKVFVDPYRNPNHDNDQMLQTEESPPLNSAKEIVNVQDSPIMVRSNMKVATSIKVENNNNNNDQCFEPSNLQRR